MGDALPTADLGSGRTALHLALATDGHHMCAVLSDHTVKCWGRGSVGQLGYGDTATRGDDAGEMGDALPTADLGSGRTALHLALATDGHHMCAVLSDHTVKCWGRGSFGQLGYGDTATRGDDAGEMGDALPTVDVGAP
eukprot:TRINITY_DN5380_c0_g2_i1.p2 TRINITY_DN5380_c0_g2~~TRINITY_DN5380_c0_g2_i1.p2  ORF type:complete len:138 (-),score=28.59 TRINITY_DN5380_c0_g2_i1:94-507(-)